VVAVPLLAPVLLSAALLVVCAPVAPLASLAAWLAWLPSTLLAWVIHAFGALPAAAVTTGRLPLSAALSMAAALLVWGVWGLPELRPLRLNWTRWRLRNGRVLAPIACGGACLATAALLNLVRPDGRVHIESLSAGAGEAVFIRGPTGRTALLVSGRADAIAVVNHVAGHLAVWEHRLDSAVVLDSSAERAVRLTLARYPAAELIQARTPTRLDVGGGAVIDVTSVGGRVSVAVAELRSAPTTSAARPGSAD
jgi:hypothetical protein